MKSTLHILSSLALAAVGASMASAQAYAYSTGYASALLYNNSAGSFALTYASGTYYSYGAYSTGNAAYADYLGTDNISYINQYGAAAAGGPFGYASSVLESRMVLGVTNFSNYAQTYTAKVSTFSYSTSSINGYGNYSAASSFGWAYDTTFFGSGYTAGFDQYSESSTLTDNLFGIGGDYFAANYSNGSFNYVEGFYGVYSSLGLYAYAEQPDFVYGITVAAGATDYVVLETYTSHTAYNVSPSSGVPGPAAVAPFAVGLLGALRRRVRKS
jgi:MYXO-CTERM domain-containing protein